MFSAGAARNKQEKDEIDGLVVDGVEWDRGFDPREQAEHSVEPFNPRMGQGEAAAKSGGAKLFARLQRPVNTLRVQAERCACARCKLKQQLRLAACPRRANDLRRIDEIYEIHNSLSF